jgi:hypothetical protein
MLKIFVAIGLLLSVQLVHSQSSPGVILSGKIADRMRDSLQLTNLQRDSIYAVNITIMQRKTAVRQRYTSPDSLRYWIQLEERSRDSLYRPFLTEQQYGLYKSQKGILISNN